MTTRKGWLGARLQTGELICFESDCDITSMDELPKIIHLKKMTLINITADQAMPGRSSVSCLRSPFLNGEPDLSVALNGSMVISISEVGKEFTDLLEKSWDDGKKLIKPPSNIFKSLV